ncbi:hypothetical protein ILUMI_12695 [Ignelater luminosus]|uniref:Uncharacterized protein n=1 Tax=Ignelater luminosus TaxID=2038154 RepID=A0A8K0CY33_IGNLU|nr:hypothetical protein ILUMI_12695 [Ignelater luminosus]
MKGNLQRDSVIRIGNQSIRRARSARYLGLCLDERQNFKEHVEQVCSKATAAMQKIASLAQRQYRLPLVNVRAYMNTVLASIVGDAASAWVHRINHIKIRGRVDRTQRGVLVRLTGAFSRNRNSTATFGTSEKGGHVLGQEAGLQGPKNAYRTSHSKREVKAAILQ